MKWISVKDELPNYNERVLVYGNGYTKHNQKDNPRVMIGILSKTDDRFRASPGIYLLKATHWMLLPEEPE